MEMNESNMRKTDRNIFLKHLSVYEKNNNIEFDIFI